MLPSILEPVPGDLARWYAWGAEDEETWDKRDLALSWISGRTLDLGYLSPAADIRLWADLTSVYITWDNRGFRIGKAPASSA